LALWRSKARAPAPASPLPRYDPLGPHTEASPWSVGPCAAPGTAMPPPCSPSPRAPRVPAVPPNQWSRSRTWPAPTHAVATPRPMPRPVLPPFALVCKQLPPPTRSSAIKAHHRPSLEGTQRHQAAIAVPSVPTVNSILQPLAMSTRATPASLLHQQSFHARLLATPSRRLARAELPTAAAAGLRHT
jgi:hypothetical protein